MLEINKKIFMFNCRQIWFNDIPFDVKNCAYVVFRNCNEKVHIQGFQRSEFTTLVIDLTQDLSSIWDKMSQSSCKYAIKRAEREGVIIKINDNYAQFLCINKDFRKKKGTQITVASRDFLVKYGTLFTAEVNNDVICGQVYLEDKDNIRWLIGASKRLHVDKQKASLIGNANRLLIWEAIKYAKEKGLKLFDLGGYYTGKHKDDEKERINKFKKSLGGRIETFYTYQKYYSLSFYLLKKFHKLSVLIFKIFEFPQYLKKWLKMD